MTPSQSQTGNVDFHFDNTRFHPDAAQQLAIAKLEQLYFALSAPAPKAGLFDRLLKRPPSTIPGLYIWGGVGRGKTLLMDHFYEALPFADKRRVHFHRFMQEIHAELQTLPKSPDPLVIVAERLATQIRLLCLDEFHVSDIGDAMLLAGLLKALFENGVTLVTTSNIPPDELYKTGLQRERFLPAIELIKTHTETFFIDSPTDYRMALLERTGTYHISDENTAELLEQQLKGLAPDNIQRHNRLHINKREVDYVASSDDVIWFEFSAICETHRSAADYILIGSEYHSVIISDVPTLSEAQDDVAQRFIHLIDALYDHNVKTIISAANSPSEIYTGQRHAFAFQRTASRLQEMSSEDYICKAHRS